ncbi:MAG: alpha/beta hydrolase [Phycisphaerales bacterium]|nr:alpha/beta hydrolase [Planctomycetota bacterium]MBL6996968.1 alpha/beta hydrolase [Phycisphaerales bacterium]
MTKQFLSQCISWLFFVATTVCGEEPRLYSGEIQIPSMGSMVMTLGVSETDEGTFLLLTVPAQGAKNIPLPVKYTKEGAISAELKQAELEFIVFENEDYSKLTGEMHQGIVFEIEFERVDAIAELVRPQHPEEPYPYSSNEITASHPDGHVLQGTLTIPEGTGPFPCAVFISGSGQQDRDESIMGHKPFLVVADYLTRHGIASLRFDDRGVGGSVMENIDDLKLATSEDFATDVEVMVKTARMYPEIDNKRIGVIGHSEGGIIGPIVAVKDNEIAFVVMLAGTGVPGSELLPVQQARLLQSTGAEQESIDSVVNASTLFYKMLQRNVNDDELRRAMSDLIKAQFDAQQLEVTEELFEQAIDEGIQTFQLPWMQFFLFHDPAPVLAKVSCPVLAMNGTLDVQVDSKQNLPVIESTINEAGGDVTIVELEGLNHLFQPAVTGSVGEYAQIETTFDSDSLKIISDWILKVTENE